MDKTKELILSHIDKDETIKLLKDYIKIPSVSGEEQELAKAMVEELEKILNSHEWEY